MKYKSAFLGILIVLVCHAILLLTDGYGRLYQIDVPMHLIGGFAVGMLALAVHHQVSTKHHNKKSPWWYHYAFVAGFAMMIGIAWEFHEFILDQTINLWFKLPMSQASIADTMKDLLNDWIGASFAFLFFQKKI